MRRPLAFTAIASTAALGTLLACNSLLGIDDLRERPQPEAGIGISPVSLEFNAACGARPQAQTVTVANTTAAPVTFAVVLGNGAGSAFVATPPSGTIAAGAQQVLTVEAKPLTADAAPTAPDTLIIETSALDAGQTVKLSESAIGAFVTITPATVDFGTLRFGASADATVTVTNTGNGPTTVTFDAGGDFAFTPALATVPADASVAIDVTFMPTTVGLANAKIAVAATGACNPPLTLTASGLPHPVATQIGTGNDYGCALLETGHVACWGNNTTGQAGGRPGVPLVAVPALVDGLPPSAGDPVVQIAVGLVNGACARTKQGHIYCWGNNLFGQIGNGIDLDAGQPAPVYRPALVAGISNARYVAVGVQSACAIDANGGATSIKCWGNRASGALGDGNTSGSSSSPVTVVSAGGGTFPPAGATAVSLTAGAFYACALLNDGTSYCWGRNFSGELGTGGGSGTYANPVLQTVLPNAASLVAGFSTTCGLAASDKAVWCWGDNTTGTIGDGDAGGRVYEGYAPPGMIATSVGLDSATCALVNGKIWCWGDNTFGVAGGAPGSAPFLTPQKIVEPFGNYDSVSVAFHHACVLQRSTGTVKCWGLNAGGLGNATASPDGGVITTPTLVTGF